MNIAYKTIAKPYEFSSTFAGGEFAILLYIADADISPQQQADISDALLAQGCRYAVCAGYDCEKWHDAIDSAYLKRNDGEPKDTNFVMTTWHDNENLENIVYFFLNNTWFDEWNPQNFLVLILGDHPAILADIRKEIEKDVIR
jgi:hypothetical protein